MDLHSGLPFWLIKNGLPYTYNKLERSVTTDVAVLGGGISGALVAYYLTAAGVSCVVLDARTIGLGSTCASTALLQYEIDVPLCKLKDKIGIQQAVTAYRLCSDAIKKLAEIAEHLEYKGMDERGSLYYAAYKKHTGFLKEEYGLRKEYGFNVTFLDQGAIRDQFGFDAPAAILSHVGAQLNAYLFAHSLLQHSMRKGLLVFDRTNAHKIDHRKNNVILETDNGYKVKARKLIYATGYEVVKYIDKKIVDLYSTYAVASENITKTRPFWKDDVLIWNTANPYLYMRSTDDNRIICGGRDEKFITPLRRDALIKQKRHQLTNDFLKLFPHIPFRPEFSWTGIFGSTKDGLPFIGSYKKLPNSFFALGFGGNGITFSQVAAEILTDHITGKQNKHASLFSFERV